VILNASTTTPVSCLLIDGRPAVAAAIWRALDGAGLRIVGTATSAARGLQLLETREADVAVVDRRLPDMDGIELAVAISRSPCPARTLLCTGTADPALAGQALAAGVNGLITSGSPASEVVRAVRAVAAGGTYVDPRLGGPLALRERLPALAERHELLLQYLADGLSDVQIGEALQLARADVGAEVSRVVAVMGTRNRAHAVAVALKTGLIE
jgi:DNA-binding NarL/FixJ family response regulator